MMTNLKVDIIYYKTSSDFELEFNLSGCCRMRIFKDKVENAKGLVTTLARDVARSRIILIVTDLVGDKNGVEIVCSSIGYDYESIDKGAYSIKTDENIKAPRGSLPLVTKSGQYGGCILESGKQSIIMVSSDRALRHEVMRLYIHQYIFDINQVEAFNERLRHENEHNPIIDGSNILSSARQEFAAATEIAVSEAVDIASSSIEGVAVTAASGVVAPVSLPETAPSKVEETTQAIEQIDEAIEPTEALPPIENETEVSEEPTEVITEEVGEVITEEVAEETACTIEEAITEEAPKEAEKLREKSRSVDIIRSNSEGFVAMTNHFIDDEEEDEPRLTKRHKRRSRASNIILLVISVLLLVCFGLLAYYLVYLPITGGELPNDLVKIISEVLPWTT